MSDEPVRLLRCSQTVSERREIKEPKLFLEDMNGGEERLLTFIFSYSHLGLQWASICSFCFEKWRNEKSEACIKVKLQAGQAHARKDMVQFSSGNTKV